MHSKQSEKRRRGLMLVLSSPSGAGKSTIARRLMEEDVNITMSISATTRSMRPGEIDGVDYRFIGRATFDVMVANGEFLEHAEVFDNCYGTPRAEVDAALARGQDILFDIDWQGTQQLVDTSGNDLVTVFILPPSYEELERRLKSRASDSADVVARRMACASDEMSHYAEYDFIVVNHDLDDSVALIRAILTAERHRRIRCTGLVGFVKALRGGG